MADNMSDYLENKLVDHILRGLGFTMPTGIYVGLFTVTPSESGGGTEVSITGTAYARIQVGPSTGTWTATQGGIPASVSNGSSGQTSNNGEIVYTIATANWGTIAGIGIFDALTGGNLLFYGPLTASKIVNTGDQFKIAAGNCPITFA